MSDRRIKHTKNYRLFNRSAENRPLNLKKHRRLIDSMKKYGYIPSFPIVVRMDGERMLVVDGQHRLAVAESLGLEVWFVLEELLFDVADANSGQKGWTIDDYAQRYVGQNLDAYKEVVEFSRKHHMPVGVSAAMLSGTTTYSNVEAAFRTGAFVVKDREWADRVASIHAPFVRASKAVRNSRFLEACMAVCRVDDFDPERLVSGMDRCREKLVAFSTRDAYLDMLEQVYNYGRRQHVGLKAAAVNAMKARNVVTKQKIAKGDTEPPSTSAMAG